MQIIAQVVGNGLFYLVIEPGLIGAPQPQPMARKLERNRMGQAVGRPVRIKPKPPVIHKRR